MIYKDLDSATKSNNVVEKLDLSDYDFSLGLPKEIFQFIELKELYLDNAQLEVLPKEIGQFKKLEQLTLLNNSLEELPEEIGELKNLNFLVLNKNKLKKLPNSIGKLKKLKSLSIRGNQITGFPSSFAQLSNLGCLDFRENNFPWGEVPLPILKLTEIYQLDLHDNFYSGNFRYEYKKFYELVVKYPNISDKSRRIFFHFFAHSSLYYMKDTLSLKDCLDSLVINYKALQDGIQKYIQKHFLEKYKENPLKEGEELVTLGAFNYKKKEIKERLDNIGIKVVSKAKASTTHLLIGKKIKKYDSAYLDKLTPLTEVQLQTFLDQQKEVYLKNENTEDQDEMRQKVKDLLLDKTEEHVLLALELAKTGGVPKELITPLFLVYKNSLFDKKTRTKAQKLLKLNASNQLKDILTQRAPIFGYSLDQHVVQDNINKFTRGTELEPKLIAKYIGHYYPNIFYYWFNLLNNQELSDLLKEKFTLPHFWLDLKYFMWSWRDHGDFLKTLNRFLAQNDAPRLRLRKVHLRKFPLEILVFKKLEELNISGNTLRELPKEITQFDKLHTLDISENKFPVFPKILDEMPNLKTILVHNSPFLDAEDPSINFDPNLYTIDSSRSKLTRK